jgi:hypothetical protein
MIQILENLKHHNESITGIISPEGKAYLCDPYHHLDFILEMLKDENDIKWLEDFQRETAETVDEMYSNAEEEGGGWHYIDFYEGEQETNLMTRLYEIGFFRFHARRQNNIYTFGGGDTYYTVTIEGSKKNAANIVNLIADLRNKFEQYISINVETR